MSLIGDSAVEIEPVETGNIGSLARLVLAELPGVPDVLVRQQLGFALREFCRETDACTVEMPCVAQPTPSGRYAFPVVGIPHGMVLGTVLDVAVNGDSVPFEVKDNPYPHVLGYICEGDRAVVRFSVWPKAGGEDCPEWFKERYAEAITAGAMFHLLSMTGKGWSDPQRAVQYGGKYQQWIAEAAYRRMNGSAAGSGPANAVPRGGLFM